MTSRYAKPTVKKEYIYNDPPSSVAASSSPASIPAIMSTSISTSSSPPTLPPPPPYNDHILSIPSDSLSPFASATAGRSDTHRRRQKKWDGQQEDSTLFLPHDKIYKAEQQKLKARQLSRKRDWKISICLFFWALYIRCWHIWQPSSVVFDEVHFGGFASKYIKTRFFMDVHPPLAKMLIALVAKLAGFDGQFSFKNIGDEYIEAGVPYVTMRLFCALNGVLVVPIAYWTVRGCGHSISASLVAALMVCYDNGLIANNRLILLDPPLLFFTAITTLMWVNFHNQGQRPFQFWWWTWLAMTGLGLGLTVSCKWVGLFTIATIGVSTLNDLWQLWGDTHLHLNRFLRHFGARALCLIIIPVTVYMLMFGIHFISLPNTGEGDGFMSPQFQQTLAGRIKEDSPIDIAYGSKVYIRHEATHGGYLHSHPHDYPTGSKQQQVTLYPHRDDNNWWVIYKQKTEQVEDIEYVKHGDIIRLKHNDSSKRLHSHNHRPPMTDVDYHNEVSVYGFPDFEGDANDLWRVEIIGHDKSDPESKERLRTIHSRFRLIHIMENCALFSHNVKLPDWGWGQQEVTCIKNGKLPKSVWYIESTTNQLLPLDTKKVNYRRPGFFSKFLELNKVMWETNKGLTQSHPFDSRPQDWPFLRRGINFWGKNNKHIYLLGNPFIYWGSTLALGCYGIAKITFLLLDKRGYKTDFRGLRQFYETSAGFFVIGWFLHYFPFFLMGRQLFLHHYMPALYFAILTFSVAFDFLTIRLVQRRRLMAACAWLILVIYVYRCFLPLTYGEPWTKALCESAKWRTTWDFDCGAFHEKITEYSDQSVGELNGALEKIQDAFKSYMAKNDHRELAPEVADVVNKISDAIMAGDENNKESKIPTDGGGGMEDVN